jgi:hypothetical protein
MKPTMYTDVKIKIARNLLCLDLDSLNFASIGIEPSEAKSVQENMTVVETGLTEFFACLIVQTILELNTPPDSWALLRQTKSISTLSNPKDGVYCLSYDERAARSVEEAIRLSDSLTAIILANKYAKGVAEKAKTPLKNEQIQKIAEGKAKVNIRSRNQMWAEIDHGLDLLLSDRNNQKNPEPNDGVILNRLHSKDGSITRNIDFLSLHGHQLRKWVRKPQLFRLPTEVQFITIGHYHIQMATIRHGLWILFTGHLLKTLSDKYVLPHLGFPYIEINPKIHSFQFTINRLF